MSPRATIAMVVHDGLAVTRACLESLRRTTEPFVLAVVDNGSQDDTPRFFREFSYSFPLRYVRNPSNDSVLAAYNQVVRSLAQEKDVPLVDLASYFEGLDPGTLYFFDTMHPDRRGRELIAEQLLAGLDRAGLLGPDRETLP